MPSRKTHYTFTNTTKLLMYDKFNKQHLLSIIPQVAFDTLLSLPPETVGKIVKNQLLFIVSDGDHRPDIPVEAESVWEVIIAATKQYMMSFRTHRKRTAAITKRYLTGKYTDTEEQMQELAELTKNNSDAPQAHLKKPEDMPLVDLETL